jgi:hypothetical protein
VNFQRWWAVSAVSEALRSTYDYVHEINTFTVNTNLANMKSVPKLAQKVLENDLPKFWRQKEKEKM